MKEYCKHKRGSEWRMWDLHIHTPETKKQDNFEGHNKEEKWNNYAKTINNSDKEISVIGVTDYLSIDNYFKFKSLIKEGVIKKQFDMIIPNIEMRIMPVTSKATPINLHCLFNPDIDEDIESRFLSKLSFRHGNRSYSADRKSLIDFGRALERDINFDKELAITRGIEQFIISFDNLRKIFDEDSDLRRNTIIVVSNNSKDGVTGIVNHEDFFTKSGSQLEATRESIYQLADAIFSSNEGDKNYFIGLKADDKETVKRKCGSLKPCYHGSDAHTNDKIFNPDENRFCWVKADPTFEGLKQTLFEPEDRVRVQTLKPDIKNERYVISELRFKDSSGKLFGNQTIKLNENLNSIIGGKSSGKSLLLYSTAHSIDPEQVEKTNKRLNFDGYQFSSPYDFEVIWKNGIKDVLSENTKDKNQKIIYIPQLYINYLVEKDNKDDLNRLVENILLQDSEFKTFFEGVMNKIAENNSNLDNLLSNYLQTRDKALELQNKSKELGKSQDIQKGINKIQELIKKGQKLSNLSPEEFKKYKNLIDAKSKIEKKIAENKLTKTIIDNISTEVKRNQELLLGVDGNSENYEVKGVIDKLFEQIPELNDSLKSIRQKIYDDYNSLINNLHSAITELDLSKNIKKLEGELAKNITQLNPYNAKLKEQKELQKLTASLELERKKYDQSIQIEKRFKLLLDEYNKLRIRTSNLLKERIENYESIVQKVNKTKSEIGTGINLKSSLIYKQGDFSLFNQVNKASISREHPFNQLFLDNLLEYNSIPTLYNRRLFLKNTKLLKDSNDPDFELLLKQGYSLEEVLRGLIKDSFILDFSVTYKGDDLLHMSPGKKGTVLLILFLQISSSEYPILIDQPEDNLDNRTIYDLLCRMIKQKKKDRQIIIVSHNANLVVATDSENIIVANQRGQNDVDQSGECQFEYVNGSIEYSYELKAPKKQILFQQGIREHICDILEGGNEAFKQRERKYSIN